MAGTTSIVVKFTKEKETKGTWKYQEEGDSANHKVGTLYLRKSTVEKLGNPEALQIEIKKQA